MNYNRTYLAVVCVLVVIGLSFSMGAVHAADGGSVVFGVEPDAMTADPGDEVTIDLTINTQGNLFGEGVNHYEYTLAYHAEYLTVTGVEHRDYLEGTGYEVDVAEDREPGALTVRHQIADDETGVRGSGITASVTFEVSSETPPADLVLEYRDTNSTYIGGHPAPIFSYEGVLVVDDGGETLTHADQSDEPDETDGVAVITADDDREGDENADDTTPVFGAGAVIGLVIASLIAREWHV